MTVPLTNNFFISARGLTFTDTSSVTWAFNKNTNSLTATATSSGGLTSVGLADGSTAPTYTLTTSSVSNTLQVNFNNTGAVSLTITYSARIIDNVTAVAFSY